MFQGKNRVTNSGPTVQWKERPELNAGGSTRAQSCSSLPTLRGQKTTHPKDRLSFRLDIFSFVGTATAQSLQSCQTLCDPIDGSPPGSCPWDSPGKNTEVGCHCLLQCIKVKREREVAQSCPTLSDPMEHSLPGSSVHGIFQARVLQGVPLPSPRGGVSYSPWSLRVSPPGLEECTVCAPTGQGQAEQSETGVLPENQEPGAIAILGIFVTLRFTKLQGLSEVMGEDVPSRQSTSKGVRAQWEKIRFRSPQNLSPNAIPEIHEV